MFDLSKMASVKEVSAIAEFAKTKILKSGEYEETMNNLQEMILKAAERGSDYVKAFCGFKNNIAGKFDADIFLDKVVESLISLGYQIEYKADENLMTISWKYDF